MFIDAVTAASSREKMQAAATRLSNPGLALTAAMTPEVSTSSPITITVSCIISSVIDTARILFPNAPKSGSTEYHAKVI